VADLLIWLDPSLDLSKDTLTVLTVQDRRSTEPLTASSTNYEARYPDRQRLPAGMVCPITRYLG